MNLDDAQKQKVRAWIDEGLKLADIQTRLGAELGLKLTYMEVRLLVDDLKLVPKDPERPVDATPTESAPPTPSANDAPTGPLSGTPRAPDQSASKSPRGGVSVSVDAVTLPGALASGSVTFSDGQTGKWYIDEMGQLGVAPTVKGYRPPQSDMASFQSALQVELRKLGYA